MDLVSFVPDVANPERTTSRSLKQRLKFPICSLVVQVVLITLLAIFVDYPDDANATNKKACNIASYMFKEAQGILTALGALPFPPYQEMENQKMNCNYDENAVNVLGAAYQETQFFLVSGIALLFLGIRRHSLSTMTHTLFIVSISLQWSILCRGFLRLDSNVHPIKPSLDAFVFAVFFAEAVLISWGILLGRISQMQLLVMTMLEIPFSTLIEYILLEIFKINDPSGAIIYNVFGTYYGLSVSRIIYKKGESQHEEKRESTVLSETMAFLGSNILWVFFPTALGAIFVKDRRLRCIINTYFALTGSATTGIVVGMLLDPKGKMTPGHVQNAVIASGVTMCAIADAMMGIYTAVIIGAISGTISILTAVYVQPFLANKWHIVDACASHTLHGLPAIFGGLVSAIFAYLATEAQYGASLYEIYPARAPKPGTEELFSLQELWPQIKAGEGRSASLQASYQVACVAITIAIAIPSGIFTGMLMRLRIFDQLNEEDFYEDSLIWNMPTGETNEKNKDKEADQVVQATTSKKTEHKPQILFDTQKLSNTLTRL